MEIRKTAITDLDTVLDIYEDARAFMRSCGNAAQWTNGHPGREIIIHDIREENSYVCHDGDSASNLTGDSCGIAGVFSLLFGEDPTYRVIRGSWLNSRPYGTVHRFAVRAKGRGVGAFCLDWCLRQCGNLRIDTHEDNAPMKNLLQKCGFTYCGVIILQDGSPRLAYQKTGF